MSKIVHIGMDVGSTTVKIAVMDENLKKIGKNYEWLKNILKEYKMKPEEALVVTIDGKNQIFCQKKEKNN